MKQIEILFDTKVFKFVAHRAYRIRTALRKNGWTWNFLNSTWETDNIDAAEGFRGLMDDYAQAQFEFMKRKQFVRCQPEDDFDPDDRGILEFQERFYREMDLRQNSATSNKSNQPR